MATDGELTVLGIKLAKLAHIDQRAIANELGIKEHTMSRISNNPKCQSKDKPLVIEWLKRSGFWDASERQTGAGINWSLISRDLRRLADDIDDQSVSDFEKRRRINGLVIAVSEIMNSL